MIKVDAHNHFWRYDPTVYGWIDEGKVAIRKDFLPPQIEKELQENGIEACMAVQSEMTEKGNLFLLELADKYSFILGIIAWVDLEAVDLEQRLAYYSQYPRIKGFRHVLQDQVQRDYMLRSSFLKGIGCLKTWNYTYDILIFPDQIPYCIPLVQKFPDQAFILDHIGKPDIKSGQWEPWARHIHQLAKNENLYCKLSGMVTEANHKGWTYEDLLPFMEWVLEAFGSKRLIWGSDWPVCLLAGNYPSVLNPIHRFLSQLSLGEQENIMGGNAFRFYNL